MVNALGKKKVRYSVSFIKPFVFCSVLNLFKNRGVLVEELIGVAVCKIEMQNENFLFAKTKLILLDGRWKIDSFVVERITVLT